MIGGRVLGSGMHGTVMDMASLGLDEAGADRDRDTLHWVLSQHGGTVSVWCVGREQWVELDPGQTRALVRAAQGAGHLVAKQVRDGSFEEELRNAATLGVVFGSQLHAHTTAGHLSLPGVGKVSGLALSSGERFLVSTRCHTPLDTYAFEEPEDVRLWVRHILESLRIMQAKRWSHNDVKLANMMVCGEGRAARFKLIDWGSSTSYEALKAQYVDRVSKCRANATSSPMTWFACGVATSSALFMYGVRMLLNFGRQVTACPPFARFVATSYQSYSSALARMMGEEGGWGQELGHTELRRAILDRHTASFDMYGLGVCIMAVSCKAPLPEEVVARMRALAHALTHYDSPDFCQDAGHALERWDEAWGRKKHGAL